MNVTVIARNARCPKGAHVHRIKRLHPADARSRHGIPTTSPARTLLDLATQATDKDLAKAVNEARVTKGALIHTPAFTRSEAERRFLELVCKARLPPPITNTHVHGYEVDAVWPDHNLILEVDGYDVHSTRAAFERDRSRDAELHVVGYRVIRVTWLQLTDGPEAVIATVSAALARNFGSPTSNGLARQ